MTDIAVGDSVKIRLPGEVFWVLVSCVDNGQINGVVDNHLVNTAAHGYQYGDIITFDCSEVIKKFK